MCAAADRSCWRGVDPACKTAHAACGCSLRMRMAWKGQTTAHSLQPVHCAGACRVEVFFQCATCRLSTWGGQAATHQPQPVHFAGSTSGSQPGRAPRPAGTCEAQAAVTRVATRGARGGVGRRGGCPGGPADRRLRQSGSRARARGRRRPRRQQSGGRGARNDRQRWGRCRSCARFCPHFATHGVPHANWPTDPSALSVQFGIRCAPEPGRAQGSRRTSPFVAVASSWKRSYRYWASSSASTKSGTTKPAGARLPSLPMA